MTHQTELHKLHMSQALKGRDAWNKGLHLNEAHKQCISQTQAKRWLQGRYDGHSAKLKGRKQSAEACQKMRDAWVLRRAKKNKAGEE